MHSNSNKLIKFVDSHAHLDDKKYEDDRDLLIEQLYDAGIKYCINVGESVATSLASIDLAAKYDMIFATVGIHPHHADNVTEDDLIEIERISSAHKVVAVGEIGLDYYYDTSSRENQKKIFQKQLDVAVKVDLPVVIHNRDSEDDCLDILQQYRDKGIRGCIHCFSGTLDFAKACMEMGFYISFAGQITFPKAEDLREVVKNIPLDKMLIETDSPYLAPQPKRGKRNEPPYVSFTAHKISELKGVDIETVAKITAENTAKLFSLSIKGGVVDEH